MKFDRNCLRLYVVTDRTWLHGRSFLEQIETVLQSGATLLQLREKDLPENEFLEEAKAVKRLTDRYGVPLIINDNVHVALACNAAGVHVGQQDMEAQNVRALLGENKIIGVTAKTVEQAQKAEQAGADYLGSGAVFGTLTKPDALPMTMERLRDITQSVSIPVVAIGGIEEHNLMMLKGSGVAGAAVVSAVFAAEDVGAATKTLRALADEMVNA